MADDNKYRFGFQTGRIVINNSGFGEMTPLMVRQLNDFKPYEPSKAAAVFTTVPGLQTIRAKATFVREAMLSHFVYLTVMHSALLPVARNS